MKGMIGRRWMMAMSLGIASAFSSSASAFVISCDFGVCTEGWDGPGRGSVEIDWYLGNPGEPNNGLPLGLTLPEVEAEVRSAMASWSSVADISFTKSGDYRDGLAAYDPDTIYIYWHDGGAGAHTFPFDGAWNPTTMDGSVFAHTWGPPDISGYSGNMHYDSAETWVTTGAAIGATSATIDLQSILLHELGHSLGLSHTDVAGAGAGAPVMQPYYWGELRDLHPDDIDGIQSLYGREGFCWPPHRGVPYDPDPPTIDGVVSEDVGWRGAQRLTYGDGTDPPDVAVQALHHRTEDYFYLSFEVRNEASFDDTDLVVIGFRPNAAVAAPAQDVRLAIFPVCDDDGAAGPGCTLTTPADKTDRAPRVLEVWKNSAAWTQMATLPSNLEVKVRSHPDGTSYAWNLELKIPASVATGGASWVDFSDDFLFYANVIRVSTPGGLANEFRWPRKALMVSGDYATYPFNPAEWGDGTTDSTVSCKGVTLSPSDVGTTNSPTSKIVVNPVPNTFENTFFATVRNDMETGGAPVQANDVRVRFRIANWGLPAPGDWEDIPATNPGCPDAALVSNPTCSQDVPAGAGGVSGSATFNMKWTVADSDVPGYQSHPHQCILVEVDSLADTNIVTKSVYRNMDFGVEASSFSRSARIGSKGYDPPPAGTSDQRFSIYVTKNGWSGHTEKALAATHVAHDEQVSYLKWTAHGFRHTGANVTVLERTYALAEPVGSFGYLVRHVGGGVESWLDDLIGAEKIEQDLYQITMPHEGEASITTQITAEEYGLWNWLVWVLLVLSLLLMVILIRLLGRGRP